MILLLLFLIGCSFSEKTTFDYEAKEEVHYKHVLYLRRILIDGRFLDGKKKGCKIPVLDKSKRIYFDASLDDTIKNIFRFKLIESANEKGIGFSDLRNKNIVECYIDYVFYDEVNRRYVIACTINFCGKAMKISYIKFSALQNSDEFKKFISESCKKIIAHLEKIL